MRVGPVTLEGSVFTCLDRGSQPRCWTRLHLESLHLSGWDQTSVSSQPRLLLYARMRAVGGDKSVPLALG